MSGILGQPFASGFRVDHDALAHDLNWLRTIGFNRTSAEFADALEAVASSYREAEAVRRSASLATAHQRDGGGEVADREAQLLERTIAELLNRGLVHDHARPVGRLRRAFGVLGRGARHLLFGHDDSSARGRLDSARAPKVEAGARGGHDSGPHADAPGGAV